MSRSNLPQRPDKLFMDEYICSSKWDPSNVRGYDTTVGDIDADDFIPVDTSIDNIGEMFPSLVVTWSNESTTGRSTYDYMTNTGPGQSRRGLLLVTARAEAETDYVGDSSNYQSTDAEGIVYELLDEVERIVIDNATAPNTAFNWMGSFPSSQPADKRGEPTTVAMDQITVRYGWLRD